MWNSSITSPHAPTWYDPPTTQEEFEFDQTADKLTGSPIIQQKPRLGLFMHMKRVAVYNGNATLHYSSTLCYEEHPFLIENGWFNKGWRAKSATPILWWKFFFEVLGCGQGCS